MLAYWGTPRLAHDTISTTATGLISSSPALPSKVCLPGVTHSKFPGPANDYIEDRIDLNRELVPLGRLSPGAWLSCSI